MKPLILCLILSALSLQSQSISIFDIDTTNFPTMRAKFYAFDAAGNQTRPSASELTLSEDGVNRTITNVSCPNLRYTLSACIMVDTYSYIDLARKGAERFVSFLQMPPDEVGITYMARATLIHRDFTRDRTKANEATKTIPSAPGVDIQSMFYAEKTGGVPFIIPRKNDRKALILISDLHCPNLNLDEARLYADAKANGIRVFSVLLGTTDYSGLFKRVAEETNGVVFENVRGEAQIYNVLEEIARKLTIEPCTIEWQRDYNCKINNKIDIELKYQTSRNNESYTISNEKNAELTFSPTFIKFENPPINTKISQEVTITAKKKDFNISDIILSNPLFEIAPKSMTIPAGQSQKVIISYTASDSAYTFCKFELKSDICNKFFFAYAGWKGIKPKIKSLKLTHPNGGETFVAGSDTIITWEGIPASDTVKLEYSIDSGMTWRFITDKATGLKYKWENIPLPTSIKCLVKATQFEKIQNLMDTVISLTGHTYAVVGIAYSPDGSKVATASADLTAGIWDVNSGKLLHTLSGHTSYLSGIAYSPDGSKVATSSWDQTAGIWDVNSGKLLRTLSGHTHYLSGIAYSPDGSMVATSSWDSRTRIWDVKSGSLSRILGDQLSSVISIAYSPDGRQIATGSEDRVARIWDVKSGNLIRTLIGHTSSVNGICYSPDGSLVATASMDGTAKIWDAYSGNLIRTLIGHTSSVNGICYSPDGSQIATASHDRTAKIWDVKSGNLIRTLIGHTSSVNGICYSPDGSLVATASLDNTAKLWSFGGIPLQSDTSDAVFSIIAPDLALNVNDIDMGRVLVGSYADKTETAVVCNEGTAPLHVLGLDVTNGNTSEFAVPRGAGDFFLAPSECQTITFQFSPTQVGPRNAKITVRSTIGNKVDSINIRGEGVQPNVILNTQIVDMGDVLVNTEKDSIVVAVKNTGSAPIKVKPVQYLENNDLFAFDGKDVEFDLAANSSKSLTIYFKPKEQGSVTGRIGFEYNGVGSPLVMLLFGTGIDEKKAIAKAINNVIDFGNVEIGSKKILTDENTIKNVGNIVLNIKDIKHDATSSAYFKTEKSISISSLKPNEVSKMDLSFTPDKLGQFTGQLIFTHDGEGTFTNIELRGNGISSTTPSASISIGSYSAEAGGKISTNLALDYEYNLTNITSLSLDLEYNRTLLRPIGNYNPIVNGDKATINLNIPYNKQKAGETLTNIDFEVALGNAQGCELTLSNPKSNDNNAIIYAKSGTFTLLGICEDGGARLINPELQAGIMSISPNPTNDNFNVEVSLIEAAPSELILLNSLGQQVMTILSTTDTGKHTKWVNTDQLSTGIYYLQLRTATYIENKVVRVER